MRNGPGRNNNTGEPPPPYQLATGVVFPVVIDENGKHHTFDDPFAAAVWLLDEFANAKQVQQLRGELGRLLLTRIEVCEHPALPWWNGGTTSEGASHVGTTGDSGAASPIG